MKYPAKFKRYIIGICEALRKEFNCHEFELNVVFENEIEGDEDLTAHINTDFKYLRYTVFIRPPILRMFQKKDWQAIIECLVHEYCHILTDPIYKIAIDAVNNTNQKFLEEVRERQTQRITNMILPTIPKSIYIPKRKQH